MPALFLNGRNHRHQLFFVVGRLRHRLSNDQLEIRFHRCLCIIGLHETVGALHDARFRIGKVVLVFAFRLGVLRVPRLVFGTAAGALFHRTFGFANLLQAAFPALQFLRQFVAPPVLAMARIFFGIGCFGLQQQLLYFRFQRLLLLTIRS